MLFVFPHPEIVFHTSLVMTGVPHMSVAVAVAIQSAIVVAIASSQSTVISIGSVSSGVVSSMMITLAVVVAVLLQSSVTVNVYSVEDVFPQSSKGLSAVNVHESGSLHPSVAIAIPLTEVHASIAVI